MSKASDIVMEIRERVEKRYREKLIAFLGYERKLDIDKATGSFEKMGDKERQALAARYDEFMARQQEAMRRQQELEDIQQNLVAFDKLLPAVFKGASLKDFKGTQFEKYGNKLLASDRSFMLFGTTGIGKTRFAYALCREWVKRRESYELITATEFSAGVYSAFRQGKDVCVYIRGSYGGYGHLIIDEVDKMRGNEQEFSWFSYLINYRYEKQLQTIVMGNKGNRSAEEIVGASVYSRLSGDGSIEPIYIRGKDRRLET